MEIDAGSELIRDIDDQQSMCRQIARPFMEKSDNGIGTQWPFPGSFKFQERDGKRCESLLWMELTTEQEVFRIGEREAENKRQAQLSIRPNIDASELRQYVGYLSALAGEIREDDFFTLSHLPEGDLYYHVEIELVPDFVEKAAQKAEQGGASSQNVDVKTARQIAIELLLTAFHKGGLTTPLVSVNPRVA